MSKKEEVYEPNENQIAEAFIDYITKIHPQELKRFIKIDNEGRRSWAAGKQKKKQGLRKGASDYFFAKPKMETIIIPCIFDGETTCEEPMFYGLWLELKTKKGKESKEQKEFGEQVRADGYEYKCVYGLDEAIEAFEEYIK